MTATVHDRQESRESVGGRYTRHIQLHLEYRMGYIHVVLRRRKGKQVGESNLNQGIREEEVMITPSRVVFSPRTGAL
jgi:hypothetical protein